MRWKTACAGLVGVVDASDSLCMLGDSTHFSGPTTPLFRVKGGCYVLLTLLRRLVKAARLPRGRLVYGLCA